MNQKRLPKSVRKFIRSEKARIRVRGLDVKNQQELIGELYKKVLPQSGSLVVQAPKEKTVAKKDNTKKEVKKEKIITKDKKHESSTHKTQSKNQ